MPNRKKVALTGASGTIAGLVLPALRERYDLVPLDIRDENRRGEKIPDIRIADLTDDDRDAYRAHFAGIDASLARVSQLPRNELMALEFPCHCFETPCDSR